MNFLLTHRARDFESFGARKEFLFESNNHARGSNEKTGDKALHEHDFLKTYVRKTAYPSIYEEISFQTEVIRLPFAFVRGADPILWKMY